MSDSSRWYTAMELAALNLPSLGPSKRHINRLTANSSWPSRPRHARGGGREYPLSALPPAAQAALLVKTQESAPESRIAQSAERVTPDAALAWAHYERKPESLKAKARARLAALDACEKLLANKVKKRTALRSVAAEIGTARGKRLAWQNIDNWYDLVKGVPRAGWLPALAPRWVGRTTTAALAPEAWDHFKAYYLSQAKRGFGECYAYLKQLAAERGWRIPSIASLKRRIARELPATVVTLAREGDDALRRKYPAQQRDRTTMHALQCVCADGRKHDLFVAWPDGETVRPALVAWQDVHSGKILAWRVDKSENKELVRLSFGDLVERWGIPEEALLDNGRGFASKWITGGMPTRYRFKIRDEDPEGILTLLGVKAHWATPYSGQSKPIERAFADFARYVDKHPALEGAWIGNRPDARPDDYAGKAIPLATFLGVVSREVARHNALAGRRSQTCDGQSFDDVFAASYAAHPPRKAAPAQRALWLLAAEGVTAREPDGAVYLGRNRYWCEALAQRVGQKLVLRFDPQHLAAPVHVYGLDGRFVATADCVEAAGFLDHDAAQAHARERRRFVKATKTALAAERRMTTLAAGEALLALPPPPDAPAPETKVIRPMFVPPESASRAATLEQRRARQAADDADFATGLEILEERRRRGAA